MIYLTLFLEFFQVGLFTFGGGLAMIPLIEDIVVKYGWLTETEFYNFVGVCESTPGPIAINMATYIGSLQGGILGSIMATLGVVLPSFFIILLIASVLKNMTENRFFVGFIKGVKPIVVGLIASMGFMLLVKAIGFKSVSMFDFDIISTVILGFIVLIFFGYWFFTKKKLSAIKLIVLSAVLGIVVSVLAEKIY